MGTTIVNVGDYIEWRFHNYEDIYLGLKGVITYISGNILYGTWGADPINLDIDCIVVKKRGYND